MTGTEAQQVHARSRSENEIINLVIFGIGRCDMTGSVFLQKSTTCNKPEHHHNKPENMSGQL